MWVWVGSFMGLGGVLMRGFFLGLVRVRRRRWIRKQRLLLETSVGGVGGMRGLILGGVAG